MSRDTSLPKHAAHTPDRADMWDAEQYLRYADERSRPFFDLTNRIAATAPNAVVDLGCGPGQLTATLAQRWPGAEVVGVDNSADMIAAATAHAGGLLRFEMADLEAWTPVAPVDVVVANATFQWVPGHLELLPRLVSWLRPGGWLAFQVPGNFRLPSHQLLAQLRLSDRWRAQVGEGAERHLAVADPATYAALLGDLGCEVDAWETTYLHLLRGADPVVDWVKGTGLRPVLAALDPGDQAAFLAEYAALLCDAYPSRADGITPFPFRRIFVVAVTPGA